MEFLIENLGIDNSDTFPGYGLGPDSHYDGCVYGIGDTEQEALEDAIDTLAEAIDLTQPLEATIRASYFGTPGETTVAEELGLSEKEQEEINDSGIGCYFHVGIKWKE